MDYIKNHDKCTNIQISQSTKDEVAQILKEDQDLILALKDL